MKDMKFFLWIWKNIKWNWKRRTKNEYKSVCSISGKRYPRVPGCAFPFLRETEKRRKNSPDRKLSAGVHWKNPAGGKLRLTIKLRLQKQRPKNFKGHSIGCSDVIIITDDGKTTAYYVNKDGFIIIPEFLTIKSSSDTRLSIDTTGYEIEGKKGTWLAQDYILMNEKKWFLMEHEEYGTRAAYVILSEEGTVVMNDCYNGFDEEARRNIQNFMQQQAEQAQQKTTGNAGTSPDRTDTIWRNTKEETRAGKLAEGYG